MTRDSTIEWRRTGRLDDRNQPDLQKVFEHLPGWLRVQGLSGSSAARFWVCHCECLIDGNWLLNYRFIDAGLKKERIIFVKPRRVQGYSVND